MYLLFADLEQDITSLGLKTVLYASIVLAVCTLLALVFKKSKLLKLPLFLLMSVAIVGSTLLLVGSTVYLNTKSESGGPVHWHTDVEFWACGAEFDLRDPNGWLSNKIGTTTYHEHNDKRIHLEGVVVRKTEDASLEKFMRVTGGYLADDRIGIPLNQDESEWFASAEKDQLDGDEQPAENFSRAVAAGQTDHTEEGPVLSLRNGGHCGDSQTEAAVQAFVYRYNKDDDTYTQEKLASPMDYIMRDEPIVPPGDCLIIEYDQPKQRTDKLCAQYGVRDNERCVEFGVKAHDPGLCNIREVTVGGDD